MAFFKESGYQLNAKNASHDEYATPAAFVEFWQQKEGRKFTLDPASKTTNHKAPAFFTKADNGLTANWGRHIVWLNPPFANGGTAKWTTKCVDAARNGATVVALLPNWLTDTWGFANVAPHASELYFVEGRIRFLGSYGKPPYSSIFGSVVVIWRPGLRPVGVDLKVFWIKCPLRD